MIPMESQLASAKFLAGRQRAFLWSECRCGKTGSAIIAADYVLAKTILVVTTASGRGVWRQAFPVWGKFPRRVRVLGSDSLDAGTDVGIISWDSLGNLPQAIGKRPDLIILDEDQRAVNPVAARTMNTYGRPLNYGEAMATRGAVVQPEDRVWHLSATPIPHDLSNAWVRMRASCPERLKADARRNWPDVTLFPDFAKRYTVSKEKWIGGEKKSLFSGGRNAEELRARLDGMFLRYTQKQIGIRPPSYEMFPLIVAAKVRAEIAAVAEHERVMSAAENAATDDLKTSLPELRRLTGEIKARCVVDAVREEFSTGLEKVVLAYWHKNVGDILQEGLRKFGVVRLDGGVTGRARESMAGEFRQKSKRVFLAQIRAASEAIDLSPANELWFVENSMTPVDMDQMSKRITNVGAARNSYVRVCCLEGTIDEKLQSALLRLWKPITQVVN